MRKQVLVKAKEGRLVRDPVTFQKLPEGGLIVELSSHWVRREKCGDVEVLEVPAEKPKAVKEASSKRGNQKQDKGE